MRRGLAQARQFGGEVAEASGAVWRRSLQLRVVVSTLALSTAVVLVLGLVLQTQIAQRLVQGKEADTLLRFEAGVSLLERDLSGVDPDREGAEGELNNALAQLTSADSDGEATAAGEFRAVLTTGRRDGGEEISAGPVDDVPAELRRDVGEESTLARQYATITQNGVAVPTLIVGQPVRTAGPRGLEFYMLFPLDSEQRTLGLVQSTLIVAGLLLLLLLAGIVSIVTRLVVRPVREAAEIAERFADGHLDERMRVQGDDEVARLGESYNEMAQSIQSQIQQLEEFGALQRRFTSDVSHELRTPLTTVRMAADVLYASREELLPALRRSSELLVTELDRFEALLADLLEISRLDAGVAELVAEGVDVRSVVLRAVEAVRGIADETGTELDLDLPEGILAEIDNRRVERIVRNLVANAVDHGEGRPVRVQLAADDRAVAVLVRDQGVGLRPGEAGLVFNRFWRAEESRARRSGGSGLGLSISVEDARLHGGWLQAWGEVGRGAAFRLTLPRVAGGVLVDSPLPLGPDESTPPAPMTSVPTPARGMAQVEPAVRWLPGDDVEDPDDDREDGARPAAGLAGEQR
ncbi:HAMP domain-containing histidine kinase [Pseudonocardia sp. KRD-184]|uniref:Sensor histidine kinase MtrB n=1 Tax=Pseudonocardia oceani TaxID=2792013 RepID=A0ABS6U737_9PSEU|nr:HAMP domain-containing histidine kinase [Pseudonocardia oceani]MBW0098410.1 HAMP domain-containing histidine kinase [Pseudonocardia oceani]MBW0110923.1 HAMP domain-containing histidine kinase [Pseudonocardia oceani]MBW0124729.1 HAMP domain-containing histidine kinase [Pseudonocardia oceani]MBW0127766.1 HAMP domain-containing histidine kinase [Pseudonocardia oceani]